MGVWTPGPGATAGDDTFVGDSTNETADGLGGNDNLSGGGGDDHLIGGAGNDSLNGDSGADTLDGGDGDDYFVQATNDVAADVILGGAGVDFIDYAFSSEAVVVQMSAGYAVSASSVLLTTFTGIEVVRGTGFDDALIGDAGNNTLFTQGGADWVVGGGGDDRFMVDVEGGADRLFGGTNSGDSGFDTIAFPFAALGVIVQLSGYATTNDAAHTLLATFTGVEGASGAALDDALIGTAANNILEGGAGADWLVGGGGDDSFLQEPDFGDVDRLFGGAPGADAGVDTIDYSAALTPVTVQLSGYALDGGASLVALFSGIENANGSSFSDTLIGTGVNNRLMGGPGSDWLVGGGGDDTFVQMIQAGVDQIHGGLPGADTGFDTIDYALASQGVIVQLSGYATTNDPAHTLLATFSGVEAVIGSTFADALIGNSGANRLIGGTGADWLVGQGGADTFVYRAINEGGDTINGFSRTDSDHIDLSAIDANPVMAGEQAFTFSTVRTSNLPGQIVAQALSAGTTLLNVYLNADNVVDMTIQVVHDSGLVMNASDFVL